MNQSVSYMFLLITFIICMFVENNDKWLRKQKELSKEVGGNSVKKRLGIGGNVIRFVSRRGKVH